MRATCINRPVWAIAVICLAMIVIAPQSRAVGITAEMIQQQKHSRLPASFAQIYGDYVTGTGPGVRPLAYQTPSSAYQIVDGYVVIDASGDDPVALKVALEALGLLDGVRFGPMVSGRFPIGNLPQLEGLALIRMVRPALKPFRTPPVVQRASRASAASATPPGEVGDQADLSMGTDRVRATYGVDGSGVMVGVMSDSYNATGGAAEDVAAGRLPTGVVVLSDPSKASDEGRAMLQLIHKIAPGSALAFQAYGGLAQSAMRVLELAGCPDTVPAEFLQDCKMTPGVSAQVIVDDVDKPEEPFFQIGLWSVAVNAVKAAGATYLTSAGNAGNDAYQSWFRPSTIIGFSGGVLHDFNPGSAVDPYQRVRIPVGKTITFLMQWNDVVVSQCLAPCAGKDSPRSDFDIGLVGEGLGNSILLAGGYGNGQGDPGEYLSFTNPGTIDIDGLPGPDEYFNVVIEHSGGSPMRLLKYLNRRLAPSQVLEYRTDSPTVYGHESAVGGMAIGASNWEMTPYFGTYPAEVTSYSALGGTPILFNEYGEIMYDVPRQPWMVAPDAVQVWVANASLFQGGFLGTSAAAPDAAAAVALLKSYQLDLTPDAIKEALQLTSIPWNQGQYDFKNGFGFIDAYSAANFLFVRPDQIIPDLAANGKRDFLSAGSKPVSIAARFSIGRQFIGGTADLYFAVYVGGQWYSLVGPNESQKWVYSGQTPEALRPYQSGVPLNQPEFLWRNILQIQQSLPAKYRLYVGLDTLPNGQIDFDHLTYKGVTVEMGLPLQP